MEPLFTTSTDYTLEEYQKIVRIVQNKILKRPLVLFILIASVLLLAFLCDDVSMRIGLILGCILVIPVLFLLDRWRIKKSYSQNRQLQGLHADFFFYPDYMESKSELGNSKIPYQKIFRILETPTNFYLILAKTQGLIVIKSNCSDELISFLQNLSDKIKQKA